MMLTRQRQMNFDAFEHAQALQPELVTAFNTSTLGNYLPTDFSATQDENEEPMDLNELCVQHPTATYYVRASGDSMVGAGIHDQDVLVLDRSVRADDGNIVVAALNGDFTVKVLRTSPELCLEPRNEAYSPVEITDNDEFEIFGVVTFVIHATL